MRKKLCASLRLCVKRKSRCSFVTRKATKVRKDILQEYIYMCVKRPSHLFAPLRERKRA